MIKKFLMDGEISVKFFLVYTFIGVCLIGLELFLKTNCTYYGELSLVVSIIIILGVLLLLRNIFLHIVKLFKVQNSPRVNPKDTLLIMLIVIVLMFGWGVTSLLQGMCPIDSNLEIVPSL